MSTIHMIKKDILFNGFQPKKGTINKMINQSSIYFPTNIIGCSLSLSQSTFDYSGDTDTIVKGSVNYIGTGIDNISYIGTEVSFTAWMQLLGMDNGSDLNFLNPSTSYLTVQAIAECE